MLSPVIFVSNDDFYIKWIKIIIWKVVAVSNIIISVLQSKWDL
jgi:hypothetical protein